jgi:hypothetical protein
MAPAVAAAAAAAMRQALRDRQILDAVGTGAAALSLVGSSFIVICYLLFRELRKFSFKLVFYLAVSVSGLLELRCFSGVFGFEPLVVRCIVAVISKWKHVVRSVRYVLSICVPIMRIRWFIFLGPVCFPSRLYKLNYSGSVEG